MMSQTHLGQYIPCRKCGLANEMVAHRSPFGWICHECYLIEWRKLCVKEGSECTKK